MSLKWLFSLFFLFITSFQSISAVDHAEAVITPPLLNLLSLMEVKHNGSLDSIVESTQKQWLRPQGKERWEIPEINPTKTEKVIKLASEMGFMKREEPPHFFYDYCIIFGATVGAMELRLDFITELWDNNKLRFNNLIILTGDRPLDPQVEKIQFNWKNETDAANYLIQNIPSNIKQNLASAQVLSMELIRNTDGTFRRPNTADTIHMFTEYLQKNELQSDISCLYISNQPYCRFQAAIVRLTAPQFYLSEVAGPEVNHHCLKASVILDTIARWLYVEKEIAQKTTANLYSPS